ncbi:hypothetical protein L1987_47958 [Smallanthus sonchifolius]|uniref:Uncharacterized protein n=1 Tax=Smallanthus sonchifolius TaxID=185202 RepID=A0ACB9FQA5_9ASTR|nr:hypothetical protein L1987_47958 [Smallanthus sonchifolius]
MFLHWRHPWDTATATPRYSRLRDSDLRLPDLPLSNRLILSFIYDFSIRYVAPSSLVQSAFIKGRQMFNLARRATFLLRQVPTWYSAQVLACCVGVKHLVAEFVPKGSLGKDSSKRMGLYDHRPLELNEDDYARLCPCPNFVHHHCSLHSPPPRRPSTTQSLLAAAADCCCSGHITGILWES